MKRARLSLLALALIFFTSIHAQNKESQFPLPGKMDHTMTEFWLPQPRVVTPGHSQACNTPIPAPSDADVLFDGTDLSQWTGDEQELPLWIVTDDVLTVKKGTGHIRTKKNYRDFQLHIEWRVPENSSGSSQLRGNSGIFLQGIYELQILDNYSNKTYANGQAASIYKQTRPLVNAMKKPGLWNVYDILYTAPTFTKEGAYRTYPYVTVIHNGVLVQNNTRINGTTPYEGLPEVHEHGDGPIVLQDHGDDSEPLSFRNIWIREL